MIEEQKAKLEAGKDELKAAFKTVLREEGFRIKATHALRHRDGAQQSLSLVRVGNRFKVDMKVRLDRDGDRGEEVLTTSDIGTMTDYFAADAGERKEHRAALDLLVEFPQGARGAELQRFIRMSLPWFDEISNREAIERMTRDNEYRIRTHGMVSKSFFEEFGLSWPPNYSERVTPAAHDLGETNFCKLAPEALKVAADFHLVRVQDLRVL